MKIGSYTLFEKTAIPATAPKPIQPVLGLYQAEAVYDRANGLIKGDGSKAVPFSIIATAQVLGARVCIGEECTSAVEMLDSDADNTQQGADEFAEKVAKIIANLHEQINQHEVNLNASMQEASEELGKLAARRAKVVAVGEFFNIGTGPAEA
ncbi:MAG: hypothetical protein WC848_01200 [Parcubacteria group bacterium]|jgi:hypothetical protein